ncbi:hypothetical protein [Clostridium brassicae]|uniref:DUF3784 domain-containing protein n=1 Tax=Clostridium brassicae TaxID=2999072 RepID=A0ABT4D4J1_9CLOT|nr:hypothetical protein [Clostridium brassicae]MCY6957192.1 hypothetical protein [Clostridium brassicae]
MNLNLMFRVITVLLGCLSIFKGFTLKKASISVERVYEEKLSKYFLSQKLFKIINGCFFILLGCKDSDLRIIPIIVPTVYAIFFMLDYWYFYKK